MEIVLYKFSKSDTISMTAFEYSTSQDFFSLVFTRVAWRILVYASAPVPPTEVLMQ